MILLIAGASHTGKTKLAQDLLEKLHYPYLSIDHLKMGLIRAGHTDLTPVDEDDRLTAYLWPIVREIIKTAIENDQNLIVEGCYIPYDWQKDFDKDYLPHIKYVCLVMTEGYIRKHFDDIRAYASIIEDRGDDEGCNMEALIADNAMALERCRQYGQNYILINGEYKANEFLEALK